MNILELCLTRGLGGLEVYVFRISQALSENNNVRVMTNGKLLAHFKKHSHIQVEDIDCSFRPLPLLAAARVARYIDKHDIELLHVHWTKDLPLAALAKKFSHKKPALIFTRQMDITRSKNDIYHRMQYAQVDLFLTITEQLAEACKKYITAGFNGRIINLYHGVPEPEHFLERKEMHAKRAALGFNDSDFVVGLFGRLEQSKGQHLLIEALSIAKRHDQVFRALIVGHEMVRGYREQLRKLAEQLGVADDVIFHDFVSEPQNLMQICDCVALTTYNETFGLVLPEAMRAGVAVIGSNRGGVPEIIEHEKTGLLFEPKNADDLYQQLGRVYNDPGFRKKLAADGKILADNKFNDVTHYNTLEKLMLDTLIENGNKH